MFGLFVNDVFKNFWENSTGDIFIEATIKGLRLNRDDVDLVFYPDLEIVPPYYTIDSNKILSILIRSVHREPVLNENGDPVLDENNSPSMNEVETFSIVNSIDPVVYCSKGIVVLPC